MPIWVSAVSAGSSHLSRIRSAVSFTMPARPATSSGAPKTSMGRSRALSYQAGRGKEGRSSSSFTPLDTRLIRNT